MVVISQHVELTLGNMWHCTVIHCPVLRVWPLVRTFPLRSTSTQALAKEDRGCLLLLSLSVNFGRAIMLYA